MKYLFFLLFFIPNYLVAQITVSGTLTDAKTNHPVEYATVYINGTQKGTISNTNGTFRLNNIPLPCEMVISHINYKTRSIKYPAQAKGNQSVDIELEPRKLNIHEIVISDKDRRRKNLEYFQHAFLGLDKWGEMAFIQNDSVLYFKSTTRNDINREWMEHPDYPDSFRVIASAPLTIKLPLLGYNLNVNLEYFTVNYIDSLDQYQTTGIGYTYFMPTKTNSKNKQKRIEQNRKKVYYNSRFHFFRSLNQNNLKLNGYELCKKGDWNSYKNEYSYHEIDIDNYLKRDNGKTSIIGLKGKVLYLLYYRNFDGNPANINQRKPLRPPLLSSVYFSKDTCIVQKNGRIEDQSIIFGPAIGDKKIGTWLPDDYYP